MTRRPRGDRMIMGSASIRVACLCILVGAVTAHAASAAQACQLPATGVIGRLAGDSARELTVPGRGDVKLAGILISGSGIAAANRFLARADIWLSEPGTPPDRWQRTTVRARLDDGTDGAVALLDQGLGMAIAHELPPGCRNSYLQAEQRARLLRVGIWSVPDAPAAQGQDGHAVRLLAGRYAVMEGRIVTVGLTRRAMFLNFGRRGEGASAELPLTLARALERQGWTRERLRGQMLRVRGVVMEATPARMLVMHADAIEWMN